MISGRKCIHLRESLPQQAHGEGRESEEKVELWLWELEQWVRREGPTITASCVSLQKCLHHDSVRGGCVFGLREKNPYESWRDTVHAHPSIPTFNAGGWWGGHRMAGCRCWQRSELFVPAVEDSTQMSSRCSQFLNWGFARRNLRKGESKRLHLHLSV